MITKQSIFDWLTENYPEEVSEKGNCGTIALILAIHLWGHDALADAEIVHGYPMGQGEIDGIRHWHAWVEHDGRVLDFSRMYRGIDTTIMGMPVELYYRIGKMENDPKYRFSQLEAVEAFSYFGHSGPWDGTAPPLHEALKMRAAHKKKMKARKKRKTAKRNR